MKGYTKIDNYYLEWLIGNTELTGLEIRILLHILRKTSGWGKSSDGLSFSKIAESVKCSRRSAIRAINKLVSSGSLVVTGKIKNRINKFCLSIGGVKVVTHSAPSSDLQDTKSSDLQDTHKRNKETIQKGFKRIIRDGKPIYIEE